MTDPAQDDEDDFDDEDPLAEIRERFVQSLADWKTLAETLREASELNELRSQCHRIKGTAAMLGCHPLSKAGAAAEAALREAPADQPNLESIITTLEAIYQNIDELIAGSVDASR